MTVKRQVLGTICLGLGTFLNPFGFDILVAKLMELMGGYWNTMLVLYLSALLSFGLSVIFFKRNNLFMGKVFTTIALFLNPFGYDFILYGLTCFTGDYWMAIKIMYGLAILFFGLFMYLCAVNPIGFISAGMKLIMNYFKKLKKWTTRLTNFSKSS